MRILRSVQSKAKFAVRRVEFARHHIRVARGSHVDPRAVIGKCTRINRPSEIGPCTIGAYCAMGGRLVIRSTDHHMGYANLQDWNQIVVLKSRVPVAGKSKGMVEIGNAVWIGDSVIILPGVTVGNGAVIGAGSVVTKPIPAYAIAVGNPARVIKKRFSEEVIAILQQVPWWDWSWETMRARREFFETDLSTLTASDLAAMLERLGVRLTPNNYGTDAL